MIDLKTLAREILEVTCEEDRGYWGGRDMIIDDAEERVEAILQRWLNENRPDPREVLLSDEFLRKFAAASMMAILGTPIDFSFPAGKVDSTRVEFDPSVSVTSTEDQP